MANAVTFGNDTKDPARKREPDRMLDWEDEDGSTVLRSDRSKWFQEQKVVRNGKLIYENGMTGVKEMSAMEVQSKYAVMRLESVDIDQTGAAIASVEFQMGRPVIAWTSDSAVVGHHKGTASYVRTHAAGRGGRYRSAGSTEHITTVWIVFDRLAKEVALMPHASITIGGRLRYGDGDFDQALVFNSEGDIGSDGAAGRICYVVGVPSFVGKPEFTAACYDVLQRGLLSTGEGGFDVDARTIKVFKRVKVAGGLIVMAFFLRGSVEDKKEVMLALQRGLDANDTSIVGYKCKVFRTSDQAAVFQGKSTASTRRSRRT
jgi:hypothetical protein